MSAAVWAADLGLKPLLIERDPTLGGQLLWTHNPITNYLGAEARDGAELAPRFTDQVERTGIGMMRGSGVESVDLGRRSIKTSDGTFVCKAIVIATGVRRRKLGVAGEDEFAGHGLLMSGARDRESVRDRSVVIVGGGDAALENAVILSEFARSVRVIHRRSEFAGRDEFVKRAGERSNIEFLLGSVVTAIAGSDRLEHVTVRDASGLESTVRCDALLIRIGVEPNTELFKGQIDLDERGYIVVDKELRTSVEDVWAIGDVAAAASMTIARAVGNGAEAAKSILNRLTT